MPTTLQRFGVCDGFYRPEPSAGGHPTLGPGDPAAVAHFRLLLKRHPAMAARLSAARFLARQAPDTLLRGITVRTARSAAPADA